MLVFLSDGEGIWGSQQVQDELQKTFGSHMHFINFGETQALNKLAVNFGTVAMSARDLVQLKQIFNQLATEMPVFKLDMY